MSTITQQRCFNHATREAVARCPECRRFFCRECVTEHEHRVLCAACLKKLARAPRANRSVFRGLLRVVQCVLSLVIAWFFFFLIGETLLSLPDSFHEGTIWQVPVSDKE